MSRGKTTGPRPSKQEGEKETRVEFVTGIMPVHLGGFDLDAEASSDDDNPEWTEADFARAKRGDDIPAHIRAAFPKTKAGRPKGSNKEQVALRLDKDVLAKFRATGPGWQTRINEALRRARV